MTCKTLMDFTVQLLEDRWCVLKWQPFNVHACPGAGVCIRAADEQEDLMPCDPDLAERWCASSVRHSCGGCGVLPCAQTQYQCSFACVSMLPLAKHCKNSRETSSGCGVHDGGVFLSLRLHHCHAAVSPPGSAIIPIKTHLISLPCPSPPLFPCHGHGSFLSTVSEFVPRGLDTCDNSVTHHTHPCNMYAEEGTSTAGVRAESLLSLTTACRLKFPLPFRCCMHFFSS